MNKIFTYVRKGVVYVNVQITQKLYNTILAFWSLIFSQTPAQADFLGGKWGIRQVAIYEGLQHDDPTTNTEYHSGWNNAFNAWYDAYRINNLKFNYSTGSLYYAEVNVTNADYQDSTWDGRGTPGPNATSGTYTYGTIKINDYTVASYSANQVGAILSHEMGHVAGLAHAPSGTDSIMVYGAALTDLRTHDINDIKTLYP